MASSEEPHPPEQVSRREALRRFGWGGLAVGAGIAGGSLAPDRSAAGDQGDHAEGYTPIGSTTASSYGGAYEPPRGLGEDALNDVTWVPARTSQRVREYEFDITETTVEVADGTAVTQWRFAGSAPGPIIRADEGDTVRVRLRNLTDEPHSFHLHGRHSPQMDGWEPIRPGGEFTYEVTAAPAGLHPYHCHVPPLAHHVSRGLYGMMIVDPPSGRPDAHEVSMVSSAWSVAENGVNDLYCWNGVAGFYAKYPIKLPVGEPVRVYLSNMVEHEPMASFHLHAQTFDVYRSGTGASPDEHSDTIGLSQGQRAILEFDLPERGRYMFHPHQHWMAARGAMGWFSAI